VEPRIQSSARSNIAYGLLAVGIGLFYVLYGLGIFGPVAHRNGDEPAWLGLVAGLIFLVGGLAVAIQTLVKLSLSGDGTMVAAPPWLKLINHVMAFVIVGLLALVATWVAFGPGQRHFTGSGSIFGETGGRIMFGAGAVIVWIVLLAIVISAVRRLRARG